MNKKAATGEGITMIYRLLLITIIAFVILGIAAVFYQYYLDVRDAETQIIAERAISCIVNENPSIELLRENKVLDSCGFDSKRVYVKVNMTDIGVVLKKGDLSQMWIREISKNMDSEGKLAKYEPGYFKKDFYLRIENKLVTAKVEVMLNHEF